ncbi:MAG: hypothetical protein BGO43_05400 [Gammaproteobacteria bacterium 39-13]|nr:MFS transporter [Gammaproteobacteria bacterium]OJV96275.1 MAG: hypothetical protein BGO43_05400 [Gammaproteobacteria bacterium 39-13]
MLRTPVEANAWPAMQNPVFRMLWIATLVSNIGTWMHEVGAAWLMTSLTTNPMWVALVQAITSLSICLLAIPAGALADIIDRRRYLIVLQSIMLITAALLAIITFWGKMTPELLLFLTFCLGAGAALSVPTWQAIIPEIVSAKDLYSAIILNGVAFNISRAVGPACAGIIIALAGSGAVFAINAVSFFGIIFALKRWKRTPSESTLPAERLLGAIRAGIRYVRGTPTLHHVMIKALAFFVFASSAWALLPLVARLELKCGPLGFGFLLACLGMGAVIGALIVLRLRRLFDGDQLIFAGALCFTLTILMLAFFENYISACIAMVLGGIAWLSVISTLNTVAQQSVASWVRARALSVYLMIFYGSMALGSVFWGWVATHYNISFSLKIAGLGLLLGNIFTYRMRLESLQIPDHTPSKDSPAPQGELSPEHDHGPIMITVEYSVNSENAEAFRRAIQDLRRIRLREGAFFWTLFQDVENHRKFIECFMAESWLEHLRYHERVSISDRRVQAKVNAFHEGKDRPKVHHFVANELQRK